MPRNNSRMRTPREALSRPMPRKRSNIICKLHAVDRLKRWRISVVFLRMAWARRETIRIPGIEESPQIVDGYLIIADPPINQALSIALPLPEEEIVLAHRTRQIRTRLHGDAVLAMDNFGADLTFFDPID